MPLDIGRCPQCNRMVQVPEELHGQLVQCPGCGSTFTAGATNPRPAAAPSPAGYDYAPEPRREVSARYEDERDPYDERDYRRRGFGSEYALAAVSGPGTALQVVGGIALAVCILSLFGNICMLGMNNGRQFGMNRPEDAMQSVIGIGGAIAGLVWSSLILNGGGKIKRLENYNSSRTAAIIAILPCCCFLGTPFGIWALTVLNKPEVRDAFRS